MIFSFLQKNHSTPLNSLQGFLIIFFITHLISIFMLHGLMPETTLFY